jgi:hypothetical protein
MALTLRCTLQVLRLANSARSCRVVSLRQTKGADFAELQLDAAPFLEGMFVVIIL